MLHLGGAQPWAQPIATSCPTSPASCLCYLPAAGAPTGQGAGKALPQHTEAGLLLLGSSSGSSQVVAVPAAAITASAGQPQQQQPGSSWHVVQSALVPSLGPVHDAAAFTDPSGRGAWF